MGEYEVDAMEFSSNYNFINKTLTAIQEFKEICINHDDFPVDHYNDLTGSLKRIKVIGTFLETNEIFKLRSSLNTIKAVSRFFKNHEDEFPVLSDHSKEIKIYPFVADRIDQIINKHGKIKDKASNELFSIRKDLNLKQNSVSKVVHSILKKAILEGWVEQDTNLSIRDGRSVIPVSGTHKRRINGLIQDVSSTGKTAFIEPVEAVEINNAIKELEYAEQREIKKILNDFTDSIRPYLDDLINSFLILGKIDFIRAKARYAIEVNAIKPEFKNEQQFYWNNAVHPLLEKSLKKEGKKAVPLNIELNKEQRIILISGPNAGGKSVCLQTVGLLQYMLQCGMLVPMVENSSAGIFEQIFIDIGDEQSIENDLSTYSSHLLNMKFFIKNANEQTLILIDEFGSGTEPMLGGAIAESILNKLNNKKISAVITTHYTNLKHFASSLEGIQNGAMLYDTNKLEPIFILEIGKPGSSFAFEIAHKIGLPNDVLGLAKNKIGEEHIHFDKHLKEIIRDKRYWENKRHRIRKSEKKLEDTLAKYAKELNETIELRKKIIAEAKLEADRILKESNRRIEQTIRQIKESQAEKEKTKALRKELEDYKDKVDKQGTEDNTAFKKKLEHIKHRESQLKKDRKPEDKKEPFEPKSTDIVIGDYARIKGQESIGEVIDKSDKSFVIAFGQMITSVDKKKVEKVKDDEKPAKKTASVQSNISSFNLHKKRLDFKPGIDIRGQRVDEALQNVIDYIDEAIVLDVNKVKILHGKGNGVLRQVIRDYLKTVDFVISFENEHIDLGGDGITVVNF